MSIEFTKNIGIDSDSHYSYERYLQADNSAIKSVAKTIILQSKAKTNDEKMYAIEQWVTKNIQYKSDQENYKTSEYKSHSAPIRK